MDVFRRLALAFFAGILFLPLETNAQGLTGSLVGTIQDANGGVIPGALVRVISPALIGGARQTLSSDRGQWRIQILPPGEYVVTVDSAPRFTAFRQGAVRLGAGEIVELTVILQVAGVAESVTVQAAETNSRTSGMESRFDQDFIRFVPTRRYSMFSLINNAPGVSPTSPASGAINTVSVFGSAVNENAFLIDGTNFTCPCQGVSRAEPIMDVIQELHVQSIGRVGRVRQRPGRRLQRRHEAGRRSVRRRDVVLRSDVRPDGAADRRPVTAGTQPASGYERVTISRPHGQRRRSRQARAAVVLRRVSVSARLRQSAWCGSGVSAPVPTGQGLRKAQRGG